MRRALYATLAAFAILVAVALARGGPPPPRPPSGDPGEFSLERARATQRALADLGPRPTGSDANARARALLAAALRNAGYDVDEPRSFVCGRHGACAYVTNVVARRGAAAAPGFVGAVLLMAHLDSVPVSPGASDDGAGAAAVVEAARALAAGPPVARPLVVVLTDGEEDGLLGAEAFARTPVARTVRAAVNVDSRGGSGPSAMFETSADNAWLVSLVARSVERPSTSSLFYEIYRRMPNDTDFTVVKRFARGVNFANTRGIEHYHTPLDDMAGADPATLQHHGTQTLAVARALANAPEVDAPPPGDAAWFSVLGLGIVRWPAPWTPPIAALALALCLGHAYRSRAWGRGLAVGVASLVASFAATFVVGFAMKTAGGLPAPWTAHPLPPLLALHGAAIVAGGAAAIAVARRSSPRALWAGVWITWALLGVATALTAPGAAFVFAVPALVAGVAAFGSAEIAAVAPAVTAAVLWLPMAEPIYDALGVEAPVVTALSTTVLVTTLAPMAAVLTTVLPPRSRRTVAAAAAAVAAIAALAVVTTVISRFSPWRPQRVNVVFTEDATTARATVEASWGFRPWGDPPQPMVAALGSTTAASPLRWLLSGPTAPDARTGAPPPEVAVLASRDDGGARHVRARLRSMRGASTLILELPAARAVTVIARGEATAQRLSLVVFRAIPPEGVDVDLTFEGGPIDVVLHDVSRGVPPNTAAARAVDARPASAAPTQDGDVTVLSTRARLE